MTARDLDSLRLHPDAERVPLPDRADLAALRTSLRDNGQEDPVDITADGVILDGRTRWTLMRELGAQTIQVRVVDIPDDQQTAYIVDRALARRHLSLEQKRSLNALLRTVVDAVQTHPVTGDEMRIGRGATQRAATLGVTRGTVQAWDRAEPAVQNRTPAPTHQVYGDGRVRPIHLPPRVNATPTPRQSPERPAPLRKSRPIPSWSRYVTTWLRGARPEDRDFLRRLDREVHAALDRNGIECKEGIA